MHLLHFKQHGRKLRHQKDIYAHLIYCLRLVGARYQPCQHHCNGYATNCHMSDDACYNRGNEVCVMCHNCWKKCQFCTDVRRGWVQVEGKARLVHPPPVSEMQLSSPPCLRPEHQPTKTNKSLVDVHMCTLIEPAVSNQS